VNAEVEDLKKYEKMTRQIDDGEDGLGAEDLM
jgi:hypothetical protein